MDTVIFCLKGISQKQFWEIQFGVVLDLMINKCLML